MVDNEIPIPRPVPSLKWFDRAFKSLADRHGLPSSTPFRGTTAYRFERQTLQAAVLLKLARYISGLNAAAILLENGFMQELCTVQRTLDEMHEDIIFLAMPSFGFEKTEQHKHYLDNFWLEEPEFREFSGHQKNRWSISRKTVRGYLSKVNSSATTDHQAIAISGYLSRMYSGYVHAAAPRILELFDPRQGSFRLGGYTDSPLLEDHRHDFENQFFRGVFTVSIVARLFEEHALADESYQIHNHLEPHFH